jgi:hypothetical protein
MDKDKCDCPCHGKANAASCCKGCHLWHGINYRTYKNNVEPAPKSKELVDLNDFPSVMF